MAPRVRSVRPISLLVGLFSFSANAMLRCGVIGVMRYDLLSIIGAIGLAAWFLRAETSRALAAVWIGLVFVWTLGARRGARAVVAEYTTHAADRRKALVIRQLEMRNIRYAYSDYWFAYYISFMTNERIIVASSAMT